MTDTKNGGPAFPFEHRNPAGDDVLVWEEGMSLRDWFAGQALNGMLANGANTKYKDVAVFAYHYADEMIEERTRRSTSG